MLNLDSKLLEAKDLACKTRLLALNAVLESFFEKDSSVDGALLAKQLELLEHTCDRMKNNPLNDPLNSDTSPHQGDIRNLSNCVENLKTLIKEIKSSYLSE